MAVLGNRTYRFVVEVYRDGIQGSAPETQTHIWDVVAETLVDAQKLIHDRAMETVRPLLDSYRVISYQLIVPNDPTHYHVGIHTGETPASVGWGVAWATLPDAVRDFKGQLGNRGAQERVALVTCETSDCWS